MAIPQDNAVAGESCPIRQRGVVGCFKRPLVGFERGPT